MYNFECELCGEHFPHKHPLFNHLDWHANHPYHCEQCNCILFSKYAFLFHVQEHSVNKYQCTLCAKLYSLQSSLYNHYKSHTDKLYKCPHEGCNYSVQSECRYMEHYKYVHREKKTVPCKFCKKLFQTLSHLYTHIKSYHK